MDNNEIERIARTEVLFREVNERIAETAGPVAVPRTRFVCECGDPTCTDRVDATLAEYEDVREEGDTFLLAQGHEDERIESVVTAGGDHAVVEKRHPLARRLVLALDPRPRSRA